VVFLLLKGEGGRLADRQHETVVAALDPPVPVVDIGLTGDPYNAFTERAGKRYQGFLFRITYYSFSIAVFHE
jgi:hypothetical protein